ncbi:MAG: hypothetical protein JOZ62_13600, partial [Acidobacteriaceae bacterium]|nr:hypothetical protein [Acidobacteriaceae bacterium]
GQLRDSETQIDFFNARYFSAPLGRFLSPDPENAGADPYNPQTWNAYAYVSNNPMANVDPTGLCADPNATMHDPQCQDGPWAQSNGSLAFQGGLGDAFQVQGIPVTVRTYFPGQAPAPTHLEFSNGIAEATITFGNTPPGVWKTVQVGTGFDLAEPNPSTYDVPIDSERDVFKGQQKLWNTTAKVGDAALIGTAGVMALPLLPTELPSLLGPAEGRVFWSTTRGFADASRWAFLNHGTMLSQTLVGRGIGVLGTVGVNTYPLWQRASAAFASGAQGPVMTFTNNASASSIFINFELPNLIANGNLIVPGR